MADAMVERRPPARFFCHRCNIEFEDVLQDYICPYCASGFIEQLEGEAEGSLLSGDDVSDADMSNLDDSDDMHQTVSHPMLNDLAFLMSGGRLRGAARPESLLEQLVWTIGGGGGGAAGGIMGGAPFGAIMGGAPFVVVGAPGDYVFGGEGLDAVVTQLLGQLENAGPPPLPREQIAAIPSEAVSPEQAAANTSCSVCWDNFVQGETISRLECDHIFHSACIAPWLQLHATCPICRRSLISEQAAAQAAAEVASDTATAAPPTPPAEGEIRQTAVPRMLLRHIPGRLLTQTWDSPAASSGSSASVVTTGSSVTAGGVWAPRSNATSTNTTSSTSLNSDRDRTANYNMDIDFD